MSELREAAQAALTSLDQLLQLVEWYTEEEENQCLRAAAHAEALRAAIGQHSAGPPSPSISYATITSTKVVETSDIAGCEEYIIAAKPGHPGSGWEIGVDLTFLASFEQILSWATHPSSAYIFKTAEEAQDLLAKIEPRMAAPVRVLPRSSPLLLGW